MMTTAVIGATGRVGGEIVRGVLARGDAVAALVRDPGKARRAFGEPGGLRIRPTRLDDPHDLAEALAGIRAVFIAMGSAGIEGVLQQRTTPPPAPSSRSPAAPRARWPSSSTTTAPNSPDARESSSPDPARRLPRPHRRRGRDGHRADPSSRAQPSVAAMACTSITR